MFETTKGYLSVKFEATWCGPCKVLGKTMSKISEEFPEVTYQAIDVDDEPELCKKYKISSVPTLILFRDGEIVNRIEGSARIDSLRNTFREFLANRAA